MEIATGIIRKLCSRNNKAKKQHRAILWLWVVPYYFTTVFRSLSVYLRLTHIPILNWWHWKPRQFWKQYSLVTSLC